MASLHTPNTRCGNLKLYSYLDFSFGSNAAGVMVEGQLYWFKYSVSTPSYIVPRLLTFHSASISGDSRRGGTFTLRDEVNGWK